MKNITLKSLGVKSGYQAFSSDVFRGTVYIPKGMFEVVPDTLTIEGEFAEPKPESVPIPKDPTKAIAAAKKAQDTATKAQARADKAAAALKKIQEKLGEGGVVPMTPTEAKQIGELGDDEPLIGVNVEEPEEPPVDEIHTENERRSEEDAKAGKKLSRKERAALRAKS